MPNEDSNSSEPTIHLLIVDDEELIRTGLSLLIGDMSGITITAVAQNGVQALALANQHDEIDVALVDARMPGMSGPELIAKLHDTHPHIKCILLTAFDEDDNLVGSIKAGASGYLLKDVSAADLQRAIETAANGGQVLGASAMPHAMKLIATNGTNANGTAESEVSSVAASPQSATSPIATQEHGQKTSLPSGHASDETQALLSYLTDRERQIAVLVAQGRTNSEIAKTVFLSTGTVKNHISHIFGVLGVRNRTELTALLGGTLD